VVWQQRQPLFQLRLSQQGRLTVPVTVAMTVTVLLPPRNGVEEVSRLGLYSCLVVEGHTSRKCVTVGF
jgi:hypothetical protein